MALCSDQSPCKHKPRTGCCSGAASALLRPPTPNAGGWKHLLTCCMWQRGKLSKKSTAKMNPAARMKREVMDSSTVGEQDSKHETGQIGYSFQAKTHPCCSSVPGSYPHKKWRQLTYVWLSSYPDRLFSKTFSATVSPNAVRQTQTLLNMRMNEMKTLNK